MKNLKLAGIILILIISISCKKMSKSIDYPQSGFFGKNILALPNESIVDVDVDHSMAATLGEKATLQLRFTNYSKFDSAAGNPPVWGFGQEAGWVATNYDDNNGTQIFNAVQTKKIDLQMLFMRWGSPNPGRCRIEFMENSATVTKTIYLNWLELFSVETIIRQHLNKKASHKHVPAHALRLTTRSDLNDSKRKVECNLFGGIFDLFLSRKWY